MSIESHLMKRYNLLFHLVFFMKDMDLIDKLDEFALRGITDEELSKYEEQVLDLLRKPGSHESIPIKDKN